MTGTQVGDAGGIRLSSSESSYGIRRVMTTSKLSTPLLIKVDAFSKIQFFSAFVFDCLFLIFVFTVFFSYFLRTCLVD